MEVDSKADAIQLVTRGDDAGLTKGSNEAIRDCFENGLLRNTSVMAPCSALEHAADRLADVDGLCTGVHITLTAEWDAPNWGPVLPEAEVPSLVDNGNLPLLADQFVERDPEPEEVVAEMEAQINRVRDAGFEPAYLDTHMAIEEHLDWFAEELSKLCEREGLIDGTRVPLPPGAEGAGTGPDWVLDRLAEATGGTYLLVGHPIYEADEAAAIVGLDNDRGEVAADRANQRRMFTDDRVVAYCERQGIEPITYREA